MKVLTATNRTKSAIQKADRLVSVITGGKMRKGVYPGGFGNGAYRGPFAVVMSDSSTVKIYSYNADEDRSFVSLIIAGLTVIEFDESEVTVSGSGHIWIEITQESGTYSYECKAGTLPDETDSLLVVPLADVAFEDGKITKIVQMQYGNIHVAGRIV